MILLIFKLALTAAAVTGAIYILRSKREKREKVLAAIGGALFLVFLGIIPLVQALTSGKGDQTEIVIQEIKKEPLPQYYDKVTVIVGPEYMDYSDIDLSEYATLEPFLEKYGFSNPIYLMVDTTGQLLITASVHSMDGFETAEIEDNELVVNPKEHFDRNFTKNAFEVIDREGIPVLQVKLNEDGYLELYGFFHYQKDNKNKIIFLREGAFLVGNYVDVRNKLKGKPPESFFKYPSKKYPGVINK